MISLTKPGGACSKQTTTIIRHNARVISPIWYCDTFVRWDGPELLLKIVDKYTVPNQKMKNTSSVNEISIVVMNLRKLLHFTTCIQSQHSIHKTLSVSIGH
jgi:hypothetical protein